MQSTCNLKSASCSSIRNCSAVSSTVLGDVSLTKLANEPSVTLCFTTATLGCTPCRTFDIGDGIYNAFAMTRTAINRFGLFDENIYPAFFEDNDFQLRQTRMQPPLQPVVLRDVIMHHGKPQESAYLSGMATPDDPNHEHAEREMRSHIKQRPTVSGNYVHRKWGCATGTWDKCAYQTPFNKPLPVW
jgi:hypothetical protein